MRGEGRERMKRQERETRERPTIVIYDLLYNACVQISTSRLSHIDPIPWTLDQILYRIYFTAYNSEFSLREALLEVFVLL